MPPVAVNNSNAAKAEREERLRGALRAYIIAEKQRKKEEFEAKIEEERLRKEREARERQNDMTLEETRGQILKLDEKVSELRNQKQQLFLHLKKVLNEDENRKKLQKDSEMFAMQALQAQANIPPPQVFMPPVRGVHHQMPILPKPMGNQPMKRGRSPSPPSHQAYYKSSSYGAPKHDDGRRAPDFARVLWNKHPTQYQSPGTLFYQTTSNAPPPQQPQDVRGPAMIYPSYNIPLRAGYHLELQPTAAVSVSKTDPQAQKPTQVFHINLDQPPISQAGPSVSVSGVQQQKPQVTMEKISGLPEGVVYTNLMPGMSLHPNVMISSSPAQNQKPGSSYSVPGRGVPTAHEQQLARQQQMSVLQTGQQPPQQQMHYSRRLY